jgi:hypothetical protein
MTEDEDGNDDDGNAAKKDNLGCLVAIVILALLIGLGMWKVSLR